MRLGRSIQEGETKNFSSGFRSGWRTTAFLAESVLFQVFFLSEGWQTSRKFFCPRVIFLPNLQLYYGLCEKCELEDGWIVSAVAYEIQTKQQWSKR